MSNKTDTDEIWRSLKNTQKNLEQVSAKQKETALQMQETDKKMQETDRKMQETDKKLKAFIGETGNRWGKLGENLVKGSLAQRLKERDITVEKVITNMKGPTSEFDIVAINGTEVVVIEVKSTLDPSDVEKFKKAMESFKALWPHFKDKKVYGGLAYLMGVNRNADNLAKKEGFFVISATGDVIIQNEEGFVPRIFP